MAWRLVEIPDAESTGEDLSDGELIGVSIALAHHCSPVERDVYRRAYRKLQPAVNKAIGAEWADPVLSHWENGGASPNDVQTLKTGASQTRKGETR